MSAFHRCNEWIRYQLSARSRHGVHSPFVYRFIEEALYGRKSKSLREAVLDYFQDYEVYFNDWELQSDCTDNTLIFLELIHRNKKTTARWNALAASPKVRLSIDMYECGLLFFRKDFIEKQHFVLKK